MCNHAISDDLRTSTRLTIEGSPCCESKVQAQQYARQIGSPMISSGRSNYPFHIRRIRPWSIQHLTPSHHTIGNVRKGLTVCQGESSARAEPSEGCQDCSAVASLKRMVGYKSSSSRPNISSHGCSQVCKGILSSLGSHACTARLICMEVFSLYTYYLPTLVQQEVWLVPQTLLCETGG